MKIPSKKELETNTKIDKIEESLQPALYLDNTKTVEYENEEAFNAKILKITLHINKFHPELSKYIEEMPISVPDEKNPEINLKNLRLYYESLLSVMKKYEVDHGGEDWA